MHQPATDQRTGITATDDLMTILNDDDFLMEACGPDGVESKGDLQAENKFFSATIRLYVMNRMRAKSDAQLMATEAAFGRFMLDQIIEAAARAERNDYATSLRSYNDKREDRFEALCACGLASEAREDAA